MDEGSKYLTENFFSECQLRRIAIYFSRNCRTGLNDPLTELMSRLLSKPLALSFTMHGLFLFDLQFLYPYVEFDEQQRKCTEQILRSLNYKTNNDVPRFQYRIASQMGGGGIIQIKLNLKLDETIVMMALVKGILCGKNHKHKLEYRKHALSVQLQRIMVRVHLHRTLTTKINEAIKDISASEAFKETT